jgi:hypothetical protein
MAKQKYIRIKDFVEIFCLHKQSVSMLIKQRKVYAEKMYGTTAWRIPIEEVERYQKNSRSQTQKGIARTCKCSK